MALGNSVVLLLAAKKRKKSRSERTYRQVLGGTVPEDFDLPRRIPPGRCLCCGLRIPEPTSALPGSPEKVAVMELRRLAGECVRHPQDSRDDGRRGLYGHLGPRGNIIVDSVLQQGHDGIQHTRTGLPVNFPVDEVGPWD